MRSKRAENIGAGIMMIIATGLILLILVVFTLMAAVLRSSYNTGPHKIDEQLKESIDDTTLSSGARDPLGVVGYFKQKSLQDELGRLINCNGLFLGEETGFMAVMILWNDTLSEDVIDYVDGMVCRPEYLELTRGDETILCIDGEDCKIGEARDWSRGDVLGKTNFPHIELNLTNVFVVVNNGAIFEAEEKLRIAVRRLQYT